MKKYLYIFDMGGVVSEHCFVWKQICASMQLPPPETTCSRGSFQKLENATMRGDITSMEMLELLAKREGRPVPAENYWKTFFEPIIQPETAALIRDLRAAGNRVICGTNTIDVHYQSHIDHGDYKLFDAVYASHLMGQVKPDITFWHYIRDAENALPAGDRLSGDSSRSIGSDRSLGSNRPADGWNFSDMFFFDDMEKNVAAAASLGIHAHHFTSARLARDFIQEVTGFPLPEARS